MVGAGLWLAAIAAGGGGASCQSLAADHPLLLCNLSSVCLLVQVLQTTGSTTHMQCYVRCTSRIHASNKHAS
jgi:hypothetical protein